METGIDRAYAIEIVADAVWRVYRLWSTIALKLTYLTPGRKTSLAFAVASQGDRPGGVSLSFPFNAPGYVIETVPTESGTAFDVVRCPVADYFRKQGAVDLCTASWCNLDYALAEMKLARTKTLVRSADRCDFRLSHPRERGTYIAIRSKCDLVPACASSTLFSQASRFSLDPTLRR